MVDPSAFIWIDLYISVSEFVFGQVSENGHLRVFEQYCEADKWYFRTSVGYFARKNLYSRRYSWLGAQANLPWSSTSTLDGEVSFY